MGQRVVFNGFVGSAFSALAKRFDTQDLWNWYVERASSPGAKTQQQLLPCPGFRTFTTLPTSPVRGLFAQNDQAFAVSGTAFYELTTHGGSVERPQTVLTTPLEAPVITVSPLSPPILAPRQPVVMQGTGVAGGTTYGYIVTAINTNGETIGSPEGVTGTGPATLSASNWNTISWPAVEHATGYKIYRTATGAGPVGLAKTVVSTTLVINDDGATATLGATPPTANTTSGTPGTTTYGYKVTATLGLGETAASPEGLTTIGKAPLTSVDYTIVTWKAVVNAKGYKVYRTTGGALPPRLIATLVGTETLSVHDTGLDVATGLEPEAATPPTANSTGTTPIVDDGAPVRFASSGDAGGQLVFISGDVAYCYDLEGNVLAPVVQGATSVGFIDSYFVVLDAATSTLKVSESFDGCHWDPTQVYQRSRAGDKWLAMAVTSNNIWLIGSETGEVWVGTGEFESRFAPYTPVFIEAGVIAPATMTRVSGDTMMWVAHDKDGAGYVVRTNGYAPEKVSTTAVDHAIQNLATISDGAAFSYQQEGHTFYVLSFPAAATTWVFDLSTNEWHRRGYWDPHVPGYTVYRPQCHAFAFGGLAMGLGLALVGDRDSGVVAIMHPRYGVDIDGTPIRRLRQCPIVGDRDQEMTFDRLQLDMDVGEGLAAGQGSDPMIALVYSNDFGRTWGQELWRSAGKQGDYRIQVAWSRLGTAKGRVFRIIVSDPIPWRLVGAWLELEGS